MLHHALTTINPASMCNTSEQVLHFEICTFINQCAKKHKNEIEQLITMKISKMEDVFDLQRGAMFVIGRHGNDDIGIRLEEERSVGSINNEIKIRGKRNLESASRKLVLNKSIDLIENRDAKEVLSFRKASQGIAKLKKDWLEKMREEENESFASKDDVNSHLETVKYEDLEFLKERDGPFVSAEEVELYLNGDKTAEEKNKRLYAEVRYAKNT